MNKTKFQIGQLVYGFLGSMVECPLVYGAITSIVFWRDGYHRPKYIIANEQAAFDEKNIYLNFKEAKKAHNKAYKWIDEQ